MDAQVLKNAIKEVREADDTTTAGTIVSLTAGVTTATSAVTVATAGVTTATTNHTTVQGQLDQANTNLARANTLMTTLVGNREPLDDVVTILNSELNALEADLAIEEAAKTTNNARLTEFLAL